MVIDGMLVRGGPDFRAQVQSVACRTGNASDTGLWRQRYMS